MPVYWFTAVVLKRVLQTSQRKQRVRLGVEGNLGICFILRGLHFSHLPGEFLSNFCLNKGFLRFKKEMLCRFRLFCSDLQFLREDVLTSSLHPATSECTIWFFFIVSTSLLRLHILSHCYYTFH